MIERSIHYSNSNPDKIMHALIHSMASGRSARWQDHYGDVGHYLPRRGLRILNKCSFHPGIRRDSFSNSKYSAHVSYNNERKTKRAKESFGNETTINDF